MHPETYKMLAGREGNYWWHRVRRFMCAELLRRHGLKLGSRCLDLGSGTGGVFMLTSMLESDIAIGLDLSPIAHAETRKKFPNAKLVVADLSYTLPFANSKFDLVTIFNVLYHDWVASEASVIAEVARILKPGGMLLITEPAFQILSREMDTIAMGRRRYQIADVTTWCQAAGLQMKFSSYFTSFGFPLLIVIKVIKKLLPTVSKLETNEASDMKRLSSTLNAIFYMLAMIEAFFIVRGFRIPFGTTSVCVFQRIHNEKN